MLSSGTTNQLYSVYFTSVDTGFAVGISGTILKTTNAGANWTAQTSGTVASLNSVYFTDVNTGYIVGGAILKTTDGGSNWNILSSTLSGYSVYFTDANTGYAVGGGLNILKTSNGGINWTTQTSGTLSSLWSVYFTNADTGYAVGTMGTILKTTNGGISFIEETKLPVSAISIFPNPANDIINIEWNNANNYPVEILIYDGFGKLLVKKDNVKSPYNINVSEYSNGIYFLQIKTTNKILNKKFIIQKL